MTPLEHYVKLWRKSSVQAKISLEGLTGSALTLSIELLSTRIGLAMSKTTHD
jgi:hypothetical protein